ncbi:hypothetical protein F5884DRAFT_755418 [Xylogone sp. PMI_703]|nr:hypothetical protein F5884DRAFT_755418 [Xylogone sp. PMI_703]
MPRATRRLMSSKNFKMGKCKNKRKQRRLASSDNSKRNTTDMSLSSGAGRHERTELTEQRDKYCIADEMNTPESSNNKDTVDAGANGNTPLSPGLQPPDMEAGQIAAANPHNNRETAIFIPPEEMHEFAKFLEEERLRENGMAVGPAAEVDPGIHERIKAYGQRRRIQLTDEEYLSSCCSTSVENTRGSLEGPPRNTSISETQENGYLPVSRLPHSRVDIISRFFDSLEFPKEEENQNGSRIPISSLRDETAPAEHRQMRRDNSPKPDISREISYGESSNGPPLSLLHHYVQGNFCTDRYQTVFYRLSDRQELRYPMTLAEIADEFYRNQTAALAEGRVQRLSTYHPLTINENAFGEEPPPDFCYWLEENCFSNENQTVLYMLNDERMEHPMTLKQAAQMFERSNKQDRPDHASWAQNGSLETPQGAFPMFINEFFEPHRFVPGLWWEKDDRKNGPWTFSQICDAYVRMWFRGSSESDIDNITDHTVENRAWHYCDSDRGNIDFFSVAETGSKSAGSTDRSPLIEDIACYKGDSDEDTSREGGDLPDRRIIDDLLATSRVHTNAYPLRLRQNRSQPDRIVTTTLSRPRGRDRDRYNAPDLLPLYCSQIFERRRARAFRLNEMEPSLTDGEEEDLDMNDMNGVLRYDDPYWRNARPRWFTGVISPGGRIYFSSPPSPNQTLPFAGARLQVTGPSRAESSGSWMRFSTRYTTQDSASIEDRFYTESGMDLLQLTPTPRNCITNMLARMFRRFRRRSHLERSETLDPEILKRSPSTPGLPSPEEESITEFFQGLEGYFAEDCFENYAFEDHDMDKFVLGQFPELYHLGIDGKYDLFTMPFWCGLGTQRSMKVAARVTIKK